MTLRPAPIPPPPRFYGGLLALLFVYLTFARLHEGTSTFLLLRDQMRDWTLALGPFRALPLTGPQSTAGGASLGPIYYWVLWLTRCLIGPWFNNLPLAGAYGIAVLQGCADLFLFDTIRRRTGSSWVAFAVTLLSATSPHELAVSSTIWNPAVSVAFAKLAIALRLRFDRDASLWWTAATTACAWFAVQAHSAAIFVALPLTASYVVSDALARRFGRALQQIRVILEVILVLQVPFFISALTQSSDIAPTRAIGGASEILASGGLRWQASLLALVHSVVSILCAPWGFAFWTPLFVVCAIGVAIRSRHDLALVSAVIAPLVVAVAGLALWQGNYDSYWYLPLAPCAAIMIVLALTTWRPALTGAVLAVLLLAGQPARIAASDFSYRMQEYGPLLRGTQRIVRQTRQLRRLTTSFLMPPFSDETYLFTVLGGRLSEDAEFDAVINERGDVQFTRVAR